MRLLLLLVLLCAAAADAAPAWTFRQAFRTPCRVDGFGQGDVIGSPDEELLVAQGAELLVLDAAGRKLRTLKLPGAAEMLEVGRGPGGAKVLLAYENWGDAVVVMDASGKVLWKYETASGVDGAHWGDLDGDGVDEMVVGFNGGGGLHAVDSRGRKMWADTSIGNVWNQAVIPAAQGQPARIYATHAGGQVYRFTPNGKRKTEISPQGVYCSTMTARRLRPNGVVQVVAEGGGVMLGLGEAGRDLWRVRLNGDLGWRRPHITAGDLDGDGTDEWVFPEREGGRLLVVSQTGERLASLAAEHHPAILRRAKGAEVLAVLDDAGVTGYRKAP